MAKIVNEFIEDLPEKETEDAGGKVTRKKKEVFETAEKPKPEKKPKLRKKKEPSTYKETGEEEESGDNFFIRAKKFFSWENRRLRLSTGATLAIFSIYQGLSFVSYLFTWDIDQNYVRGRGFFSFIFDTEAIEISNHLGKLGAWLSHKFIFDWFGLPSFLVPFVLLVLGVFLLLRIRILPIGKTLGRSIIGIVVLSLAFGYITTEASFPYGGNFGFQLSNWLKITLGGFGALLFIGAVVFVAVVALFNPDFAAMLNWFKSKEKPEDENAESTGDLDIVVDNNINEADIKEDEISEAIEFDKPEDEIPVVENELVLEPTVVPVGTDEDFVVEVPEKEEVLDESELNKLVEQFGEYDPKLDLASYTLPGIDLLADYGGKSLTIDKEELEQNKNRIVEALGHYNIEIARIKATVGPTVTLYEIVPAPGVRISKIKNLADDIALSLAANGIRIIAPIPGRGTIGIEVPNSKPELVSMRSMIAAEKFQNSDMDLPIVMGKTIANETFVFDLTKSPHLLVAGATGQGKSVGLNAILLSILYKKHPSQVKFVMVDPKKVELTLYNKIERHFLAKLPDSEEAIITDTSKVVNTMNSLCIEMDARYVLLKEASVRTIKEYNTKFIARRLNPEKGHRYMPYIVVVIDEFADLIMTAGKEIEHPIARLAQLARAIGIHLIVATQRPSVNVITGMIKANFPARIAFKVSSGVDSKTILDTTGADQLIGRGDMLISFGNDLVRLQCAFVDTPEVERVCDFIGNQRAYPEALLLPEFKGDTEDGGGSDFDPNEKDDLFDAAARIIVTHQQGSASLLQRKMKIGYNRAGRLVDQMESAGIIGPFKGSKAREVLISDLVVLEQMLGRGNNNMGAVNQGPF